MKTFFQGLGLHIAGVTHLSPRETPPLLSKGAIIVDVRKEMEMNGKRFAVGTVIPIPFSRFSSEFSSLPKNKPLILADSVGMHSKDAVLFLLSKGYTEIANLNGGIVDWEKDGLPTDINDDEVFIGQCACKLRSKKVYRPRKP